MPESKKKELMDIVDRLTPTKVIQVLEFAKSLQGTVARGRKQRVEAAKRIRGKYKHVLSSTDEFARRKDEERRLEDR